MSANETRSNLPKNLTDTLLLLVGPVGNLWRGRYLWHYFVYRCLYRSLLVTFYLYTFSFFILGNWTRFMLTNIRISTIYNSHGFYRFFFLRFCRGTVQKETVSHFYFMWLVIAINRWKPLQCILNPTKTFCKPPVKRRPCHFNKLRVCYTI